MAKKNIDITITILTYNGEKYIKQILQAIYKQVINKNFEVLVIDSGSTDKTLSILTKFQNVRLHQIPNSEFGHGKTRQLAAELASGEIIVYLTHDAIPANNYWLYELTKPFEINNRIVGVLGKQIPREKCIPMQKYEIMNVFSNFGPDFGTTIFYKDEFIKEQSVYDAVGFYSDANSATKKDILLSIIPYKDVNYSEDQLFGRDIIEKGYYKVYAPRGGVIHSNDLTLGEYDNRIFDETLGLKRLGIFKENISLSLSLKLIIRGIFADTFRIIKDKQYSLKRKVYWILLNPLFHIAKWNGVRRASNTDVSDESYISKHSLESLRNKQN